ncbi:MAG: hypothetical protein DRN04_15185 [Thermoprotei archaeon]|nr:MAG: hypothetical protein DRN04_15185 [Thermoprotei archaeon]
MVKCAVFDIDGVIFDVSDRIRATLDELGVDNIEKVKRNPKLRSKFWKIFLSPKYMYLDKPRFDVINYMRKLKDKEYKIIIVTGRVLEIQGEETEKQLREYNVPYDEIYFRRKRDKRKDYEFKTSIIQWLISRGYEIIEVHEDSEEVINKLKLILPSAKFYLY